MRAIRQMIRGCGTLPHVGSHPGTDLVVVLVLCGALAGIGSGGLNGAIVGALFMAVCIAPLFLKGAYDRAQEFDRLSAKDRS